MLPLLVDPTDVHSIADGLCRLADKPGLARHTDPRWLSASERIYLGKIGGSNLEGLPGD